MSVSLLLASFLVAPSLRVEVTSVVGPSLAGSWLCGVSLVGASSSSPSDGDGDRHDVVVLRRICDAFRIRRNVINHDDNTPPSSLGLGGIAVAAVAPICLPRDAEAVRPLGPVVVLDLLDFRHERDSVDLYPSTFLVRPRRPSDDHVPAIDCGGDDNEDRGREGRDEGQKEMVVVRSPPIPSAASDVTGNLEVTDLASLIRNATSSNRDDAGGGDESDTGSKFEDHAIRFRRCVDEALPPSTFHPPHVFAKWSASPEAKRCLSHATSAFDHAIAEYRSAADRGEVNSILRRIVASDFGSPSTLGGLLLAVGECDTDDSYDEFVSCTMDFGGEGEERFDRNGKRITGFGELQLDVNVHRRNVDEEGREWRCQTCGLHQHPRWYASRVVTGNVTYTLARPDCPTEEEVEEKDGRLADLPTVEELDQDLSTAGPSGTGLDVQGARYRMPGPDGTKPEVTWETTEVVTLRAGHTVLFPPNWYHRIVPPGPDATHSAVTLVAKFRLDRIVISNYDEREGTSRRRHKGDGERRRAPYSLQPREIDADTTTKLACYGLLDVALALRSPDLDEASGMDVTPCLVGGDGGELRDVYDVGSIEGIVGRDEL